LSVHEVAASGFGTEAAAYERSRPSYPPEAVSWIVEALEVPERGLVCDLAAGTGKFTRLLHDALGGRAHVLAVEPVAGMRDVLAAATHDLTIAAGTAEALPLAGETLDAITVAQAFHWFDAPAAYAEFARVLRPGRRLALVWNARDRSVPWVDRIWSVIDRIEKQAPWRSHREWRESAFVHATGTEFDNPWFGPLHEATFHHEQLLTPDDVVERVRSVSHVAVLEPDAQETVLDEVRAIVRDDPATAGRDEVVLPYRVDAFWAERA
jgi:SAM-dependent methyltransferase